MGDEKYTRFLFDVCNEIEKRNIDRNVDIRFDCAKPNLYSDFKFVDVKISATNKPKNVITSISPVIYLAGHEYNKAVNEAVEEINKQKSKFLKLNKKHK